MTTPAKEFIIALLPAAGGPATMRFLVGQIVESSEDSLTMRVQAPLITDRVMMQDQNGNVVFQPQGVDDIHFPIHRDLITDLNLTQVVMWRIANPADPADLALLHRYEKTVEEASAKKSGLILAK